MNLQRQSLPDQSVKLNTAPQDLYDTSLDYKQSIYPLGRTAAQLHCITLHNVYTVSHGDINVGQQRR